MAKNEPAPFTPGDIAEDALVVIHRRLDIRRDKRIIERHGRQQRVSESKTENPQCRDEKPNPTSAAA